VVLGVPELNALGKRTKGGVGGHQPIAQHGINNLVGGWGCAALPLDQRVAADQELWALGQEIANTVAPHQWSVPLGTWPDAA
jgi:hypothetical protein